MASDAEVDLVVNATRAMSTIQRDLDELVRTAENSTDPVQVQAALNRIISLNRVQDDLNQVIRTAQAQADPIRVTADIDTDDADADTRRFNLSLGDLASTAGRVLGPLAGLAGGLAKAGGAAGAAVPLLAGVVTTVESIAPAAAVGVSALLTLQLASATVKVAMIGVGDAIRTAFDPDATPEELAESMKKLGPHARSFVKELQSMRKGFKALQIDVQNRLFANLDKSVDRLGRSVLPTVHGAMDRTADSLNDMAKGAAEAGAELGDRGILGKALAHSTGAMAELERIPGQAVTAFGQLAAAAGPALEGLAKRAGGVADRIAEKLSKAFESGALEKAINQAISNIDQLGRIAGNVFKGISNIIKAVSVDGQGLFGTLEKVSQAFEDLTASKEFQSALEELSKTMGQLVKTVLPLVEQAFKTLFPVIEILAPVVRELIKNIGEELGPVFEELAPVIEELAGVFKELVPVVEPFLILAIQLAKDTLPILTPLFRGLKDILKELQPVAEELAENIGRQLKPILEKIPEILEQIIPKFVELAKQILPEFKKLLEQIGPELGEVSSAIADLLVELTPLVVKFLEFQIFLVDKMLPIISPIVHAIGVIFVGALKALVDIIREFVIPIVRTIVAILEGDWHEAMRQAATAVNNLRDNASRAFGNLRARAVQIITGMGAQIAARVVGMKDAFVRTIQNLVADAVARIATLPQAILNILGGMGSLLFSIGQDIVQGLINGIVSRIGGVVAAASRLASAVPDSVKGLLGISSPSKVMIGIGGDIMAGLSKGLADALPSLRKELTGIALTIPQTVAQPVQGLTPGALSLRQPVVNVFIGSERLDARIDRRVTTINTQDTRIRAYGVRR